MSTIPLARWEQDEGIDQIRWEGDQLVLAHHGQGRPLGAQPGRDADREVLSWQAPCDIWHRDHLDLRPVDVRPRWFGGDSWTRVGIRSHPIALCALDQDIVGVATSDGALIRWDFRSRHLLARERVAALAAESDDRHITCGNEWGPRIAAAGVPGLGTLLVADRAGVITVHGIADDQPAARFDTGILDIGAIAVRPGSTEYLVIGGTSYCTLRKLAAFDHAIGRLLWSRDIEHLGSCCWDPSRPVIVAACHDHLQRLSAIDGSAVGDPIIPTFTNRRGQLVAAKDLTGPVVVAQNDGCIAVGGMGWPLVCDLERPAEARHMKIAIDGVSSLAFSPSGQLLAAGEGYCPWITVLDRRDGSHRRLVGHLDQVTALAFTPDGRRLVSAGADGFVMVWSTEDWELLYQATLLPTDHGCDQAWCIIAADGTKNGSPRFEAFLNPLP